MKAVITLQEFPGQKFNAHGHAHGRRHRHHDPYPADRSRRSQQNGKLLPGSFGEVHFSPKIDAQKVTVPVNAMLFRREGPQVAVVGNDGKCSCGTSASGVTTEIRWKL